MKLKNLFWGAVASLAVFAACEEPEQNLGTPDIGLSVTEMTFDAAGGEQTLTVTATRDWMVETDADWVVVSPESGSASAEAQTVTVSVLENTGLDREVDLKFTIGMKSKYLTVSQAGPGGSAEALIVYGNDFDKTEAVKGDKWTTYLDSFDGWKNETGTGISTVTYASKSLTARTNSGNGSAGNYSDYTQLGASGMNYLWFGTAPTYFAVKNITLPEGKTNYTLSFGSERYLYGVEDNIYNWNEFSVYVSADAKKWVKLSFDFAGGSLPNGRWDLAASTFTVPAGTTALNVYFTSSLGSAYAIDDLKLVQADKAGTAIDFSAGEEFEVGGDIPGGGTGGGSTTAPESKGKKTVAEFIAAADESNYYELTGTVSGFSSQYCSFDLTDATGKIYVYSVLDASKSEWSSKIANGGTITIYGKYLYYSNKSQHEVVDAYIVSYTSNGGETPTPPTPPAGGPSMTIAEVLASSGALASGSIIEGVVISNMDLNNLTSKKGMYIQDETAGLQFYLAENHTFAFGDKVQIDLSGVTVAEYNGAVQISGLALSKITKISSGNAVSPKVVTIEDFLANKYEGQYIAIEGVQVADADLSKTFVMDGAHTSISMEDASGKSFAIFSSKYASYGAQTVPQGSGTIKGISSISKGAMQIIFAQQSDFAGLTGTRFDGTEVTPPTGGGDEGGEDPITPPAGEAGEFDPQGVTWTLGSSAYDNTSGGTNVQTAVVNGVDVSNLLKLGTGSKVGDATLHVAAGTKKLGFYCVAWKGKKAQVKFSASGSDITTIEPSANTGATGNAPYTNITVTDSDYFEVELPAGTTDIKVETLDPANGRVLFIGLKAITE